MLVAVVLVVEAVGHGVGLCVGGVPFAGSMRIDEIAPPPVLPVEPKIDGEDADPSASAQTVLSDEKLVELAHAPIACPDIGTQQIVGYHHGVPVRVSVQCGDVCPGQEFRVVEYVVGTGSCEAVGGVYSDRGVPMHLSIHYDRTCIPAVLSNDDPLGYPPGQRRRPCFYPELTDDDLLRLSRHRTDKMRALNPIGKYRGQLVDLLLGCGFYSRDAGRMTVRDLPAPLVEYVVHYPKEEAQCAERGGVLRWPCGHDWPPSCIPPLLVSSLPPDPAHDYSESTP
jgi:hypothetical protein